jgi:hypothetical protein
MQTIILKPSSKKRSSTESTSEGHSCSVEDAIYCSPVLKDAVALMEDSDDNSVEINFSSGAIKKVIDFMPIYRTLTANPEEPYQVPKPLPSEYFEKTVSEAVKKYFSDFNRELFLETLLCANYLGIKTLTSFCLAKIADRIQCPKAEMEKFFEIDPLTYYTQERMKEADCLYDLEQQPKKEEKTVETP